MEFNAFFKVAIGAGPSQVLSQISFLARLTTLLLVSKARAGPKGASGLIS